MASRIHRRTSVMTWSLRLRAVCSFLPASPAFSMSAASMFMCTSSLSARHSNSPASIAAAISSSPLFMASRSAASMRPCAHSMAACARLPRMSCLYMALSNDTDSPNCSTTGRTASLKRPPHMAPPLS